MKKKICLSFLIACLVSFNVKAHNVDLHQSNPEETTSTQNQGNPQRSQVYIPSVYQDNYTLLFESCCIGSTIEIVQNGTVVYSSVITNEDGSVELPLYIIGECKLYLYWAGIMFEGEFEL